MLKCFLNGFKKKKKFKQNKRLLEYVLQEDTISVLLLVNFKYFVLIAISL